VRLNSNMLNLDAFSIPGVDLSAGTVTQSLWAAGAAAVLPVVLLAAAIFRAGSGAAVRAVGIAVAVVIVGCTLIARPRVIAPKSVGPSISGSPC
jgi:galactitol-specific phosphotransferase system IIC component